MKRITLAFLLGVLILPVNAQNRASWMKDAKWGVMLHYSTAMLASENKLDADSINLNKWNDLIDNFDCEGLVVACRELGLGFGFYYSHNRDWTEPGG